MQLEQLPYITLNINAVFDTSEVILRPSFWFTVLLPTHQKCCHQIYLLLLYSGVFGFLRVQSFFFVCFIWWQNWPIYIPMNKLSGHVISNQKLLKDGLRSSDATKTVPLFNVFSNAKSYALLDYPCGQMLSHKNHIWRASLQYVFFHVASMNILSLPVFHSIYMCIL